MAVRILVGDWIEQLRTLPDESVHMCVTSPPYFGLRDYGVPGQVGLEATPEAFVATLVEGFREVRRVLRSDGVLFLNMGDSYCGGNFPQRVKMREDLGDNNIDRIALEMFGVRFSRHQKENARIVQDVLSPTMEDGTGRTRSDLASEGIEAAVPEASHGDYQANHSVQPSAEMASDRAPGREVCLLRGEHTGVPDGGSCERRRSSPSKAVDGEESGQFDLDLQGHPAARVSTVGVPSALLQLQLRTRVLGILSSHEFNSTDIPASLYRFFRSIGPKPKDLLGIPWMLALALRNDGWYLRSDIVWSKPNPMPESVTDRPTRAHEYVFLLSKSRTYYYDADAIREESRDTQAARLQRGWSSAEGMRPEWMQKRSSINNSNGLGEHSEELRHDRNKRSVWEIATSPFPSAHFATYPVALVEPCIKAGCPPGGTVLDPFGGAGTTALVADRLGRDCILIELNPAYAAMARARLTGDSPMFSEVEVA